MRYFIENEIKGKEKFERLLKGEHEELENDLIRLLNDRAGGMCVTVTPRSFSCCLNSVITQ